MKSYLSIFIFLFLGKVSFANEKTSTPKHEYYFSVTDIYVDQNEKKLDVVVNLEIEDLEEYWKKLFKKKIDWNNIKETLTYANKYLSQNLQFSENKAKKIDYVVDSIHEKLYRVKFFFSLKVSNLKSTFSVKNTILIKQIPRQVNKVNWHYNKKIKTQIFTNITKNENIKLSL